MNAVEYLLSYGLQGEFGRFRASEALACHRGDRVVVRSVRGLEAAQVLCPARPGHAHYLPNTTVGSLLRRMSAEDEETLARHQERGQQLFDRGRRLADELELPLELLDVEVLLDGEHAVLHLLRLATCDVRPLVSTLAREFGLHIALADLAHPQEPLAEPEEHGCGREGCGQGAGGCESCGSGGCGSCGSAHAEDVRAHFAGLREQMERRVSLL
jgi:cell fate regulator YaaT (PSP1 superfamily)